MKRTLYPKLLGGYLIYGLICFIIISTFGYMKRSVCFPFTVV